MKNEIDLSTMLPDFSSLFELWRNGNLWPQDDKALLAYFILLLLTVASIGLLLSSWAVLKANGRIRFYRKHVLGDVKPEDVYPRFQTINDRAKKYPTYNYLWQEFAETLVLVQERDRHEYRNTYDADHFFNTTTLARGVTESRLAAAMPGLLTAVGVLGTFVGLQMGLTGLELKPEASVGDLRSGINSMINGAAVAFTSSVWGVALSFLYNLIEKYLDGWIRSRLDDLQMHINFLFPRLTAEDQLVKIAHNSAQSRETLQGLAEKIGEKMQIAMTEASEAIQTGLTTSLENIMAPAINKLVTHSTDSSTQALEQLMDRFLDGIGQQGQAQRQLMDDASNKTMSLLETLGGNFTAFMNRLEGRENQAADRESQMISALETKLNHLMTSLNQRDDQLQQRENEQQIQLRQQIQHMTQTVHDTTRLLSETTQQAAGKLTDQMTHSVEHLARQQHDHQTALETQTQAIYASADNLIEQIRQLIVEQVAAVSQLLAQGETLQQGLQLVATANIDSADKAQESSRALQQAAQDIHGFGGSVREASHGLGSAVRQAVTSTKDLAEQNQAAGDRMARFRNDLDTEFERLQQSREKMHETLTTADQVFIDMRNHQNAYLQALKDNTGDLVKRLGEMLQKYADEVEIQTNERMNHWNRQTAEYTEQMTKAVRTLSGVIDQIETAAHEKSK